MRRGQRRSNPLFNNSFLPMENYLIFYFILILYNLSYAYSIFALHITCTYIIYDIFKDQKKLVSRARVRSR